MQDVTRFARLFQGNKRSYGTWNKSTGAMLTAKESYTDQNFEAHLRGTVGLGIVPILDNGKCWWGAIDIDAHGEGDTIDVVALEANVRKNAMPLVVCKSKSGGAHLYIFVLEPTPVEDVTSLLSTYAKKLGYPGVEIFPKQKRLFKDNDGNMALGNWINLPYFEAHKTVRTMIHRGEPASLDLFLTEAESKRLTPEFINVQILGEHSEAPPCVQMMYAKGIKHYRNEGLFAIGVYLRRRFPHDWNEKCHDVNRQVMDIPLPYAEVKKLTKSIGRKDYTYRCNEEPCQGFCDRETCLTRQYGITPEEIEEMEQDFQFENLKKIMTDPPKWEIDVQGRTVRVETATLMDFNKLRMAIMEQLTVILPSMRNPRWQEHLSKLTKDAEMIHAPEDASITGIMKGRLEEFMTRADLDQDGSDPRIREMVKRGIPVVYNGANGIRQVIFKGSDFVDYLKRIRGDDLKGSNLWSVMRDCGVDEMKVRIGSGKEQVRVWAVPVDTKGNIHVEEPDIIEEY